MKAEVGEVEESRRDDNKLSREMRESKSKEELNESRAEAWDLGSRISWGAQQREGVAKHYLGKPYLVKLKIFCEITS